MKNVKTLSSQLMSTRWMDMITLISECFKGDTQRFGSITIFGELSGVGEKTGEHLRLWTVFPPVTHFLIFHI